MKLVSGRPIHGSHVEQLAFVLVISSADIVVDRRKRRFVFIVFVLLLTCNVIYNEEKSCCFGCFTGVQELLLGSYNCLFLLYSTGDSITLLITASYFSLLSALP